MKFSNIKNKLLISVCTPTSDYAWLPPRSFYCFYRHDIKSHVRRSVTLTPRLPSSFSFLFHLLLPSFYPFPSFSSTFRWADCSCWKYKRLTSEIWRLMSSGNCFHCIKLLACLIGLNCFCLGGGLLLFKILGSDAVHSLIHGDYLQRLEH